MDVRPPRGRVDIYPHGMFWGIYGRKVSLLGIGGYKFVPALYSWAGGSLADLLGGWLRMGSG